MPCHAIPSDPCWLAPLQAPLTRQARPGQVIHPSIGRGADSYGMPHRRLERCRSSSFTKTGLDDWASNLMHMHTLGTLSPPG